MYLRDGSAQTMLPAATLEIEVADPTFYLTQSQYTDTGPTLVPALTLSRQAPGLVTIGVPVLKSLA